MSAWCSVINTLKPVIRFWIYFDDSQLEITVLVPSNWLKWLKPGYEFKVFSEETQREYPAKVKMVGARIDAVSQSIKITGVITGKVDDLLAGMSGRAIFPSATAKDGDVAPVRLHGCRR